MLEKRRREVEVESDWEEIELSTKYHGALSCRKSVDVAVNKMLSIWGWGVTLVLTLAFIYLPL